MGNLFPGAFQGMSGQTYSSESLAEVKCLKSFTTRLPSLLGLYIYPWLVTGHFEVPAKLYNPFPLVLNTPLKPWFSREFPHNWDHLWGV